jgi:hypothetical protein
LQPAGQVVEFLIQRQPLFLHARQFPGIQTAENQDPVLYLLKIEIIALGGGPAAVLILRRWGPLRAWTRSVRLNVPAKSTTRSEKAVSFSRHPVRDRTDSLASRIRQSQDSTKNRSCDCRVT